MSSGVLPRPRRTRAAERPVYRSCWVDGPFGLSDQIELEKVEAASGFKKKYGCFGGVRMTIDRLIGILAVLLREEQVTAGALAERFEVSVRTI